VTPWNGNGLRAVARLWLVVKFAGQGNWFAWQKAVACAPLRARLFVVEVLYARYFGSSWLAQ